MNKSKSRKYTYEIYKPTQKYISYIKVIECIYHAVVFDTRNNGTVDYMRGFIYFKNPRSISMVEKLLRINEIHKYNISISKDKPYDVHIELTLNDHVWECGIPPIQGGNIQKRNAVTNTEETAIEATNEKNPDVEPYLSTENQDLSQEDLSQDSSPEEPSPEPNQHLSHQKPSQDIIQVSYTENQEPTLQLAQGDLIQVSHDLSQEDLSQDNQLTPFEERLLRIFEQQTKQLTNVVKDLTEKVEKATITNNTVNNNNTINNNTINNNTINVFLNDDCKHAITIDK